MQISYFLNRMKVSGMSGIVYLTTNTEIIVFIDFIIEKAFSSLIVAYSLPPWRNWLARSAVNRKVGGSSPPGGELFYI